MQIQRQRYRCPNCGRTTLQNLIGMIEFLPRRTMDDVRRYFRDLPGKERIEVVCVDMWAPCREAARAELPQAKIVIDKFHVVRMAGKLLDNVRKEVGSQLSPPRGDISCGGASSS